MAEEGKTTYPTFPIRNWWTLRRKFQESIPKAVTAGYLALALRMQERSARANVLPGLAAMGIIDKDGKPLDRARAWRDDDQYVQVCQDIRREIYPRELLDALPGPQVDRAAIETWFANKTGVGVRAARKMAALYQLLAEADPTKADKGPGNGRPRKPRGTPRPSQPGTEQQVAITSSHTDREQRGAAETLLSESGPSLHINIQIHVSSDASAEQIEHIFTSMAKHLYGR